jgi:hypothetical protein
MEQNNMIYKKIITDSITGNVTEVDYTPEEITEKQTEETQEQLILTDAITKKASGKQKLLDLGLSEEEVKALIGV